MIHINNQSVNNEGHVAFGGEKQSGIGRFKGEWGLGKQLKSGLAFKMSRANIHSKQIKKHQLWVGAFL